jgi:hypothetical protein
MQQQFKSSQRGVTFLGMLFVGGILAAAGVVMAQVFPTFLEYQAVSKAVNKSKDGGSVAEVRALFDKAAQIDDIKSIGGKDLEVTKEGEKVVIRFAYERQIHLTGPAWLTMKYTGRSK